jgi:hypothetical protein
VPTWWFLAVQWGRVGLLGLVKFDWIASNYSTYAMFCFSNLKINLVYISNTDYGHTKAKSLILISPNSNQNPK